MTRYDTAITQKKITDAVVKALTAALGRDKSDNDKGRIELSAGVNRYGIPALTQDMWTPAVLYLSASHGYYGSSSGYNDMTESVAMYMLKALQEHLPKAAEDAIALALNDLAIAKKEAAEEAALVLAEMTTGGLPNG